GPQQVRGGCGLGRSGAVVQGVRRVAVETDSQVYRVGVGGEVLLGIAGGIDTVLPQTLEGVQGVEEVCGQCGFGAVVGATEGVAQRAHGLQRGVGPLDRLDQGRTSVSFGVGQVLGAQTALVLQVGKGPAEFESGFAVVDRGAQGNGVSENDRAEYGEQHQERGCGDKNDPDHLSSDAAASTT